MKLHRNAKTTPTSRLELVLRTVDDGWRYQAVAEGYGVSVRTVAKWVQRFRQLGAAGLEEVIQAPADAAHHLASPGDVHSPVAGAARLASLGDRPRVADAAVHGRGLGATLGIEPAAYRPVGAHPALRVAAPGGFVARRHQAAGRRCCMKTLCQWGGVARTSRDPPQEPHYGDAVEGSSQV